MAESQAKSTRSLGGFASGAGGDELSRFGSAAVRITHFNLQSRPFQCSRVLGPQLLKKGKVVSMIAYSSSAPVKDSGGDRIKRGSDSLR